MESLLIVGLVGLTSLAAYLVARRWLRLRAAALFDAWARVLECAGLTIVFLTANLALGMLVVLGYRASTGRFLTIYAINDVTIVFFSGLQAIVLRWWWDSAD